MKLTFSFLLIFLIGNLDFVSSYSSNSTDYVGVIDDSYLVNNSGAYNHIIPIQIPKGIGGLQPSLSLFYDSRSSISEVGYGWNLNGISKISRASKNIANNGYIDKIQFDSTDPFMIDGQYLQLVTKSNTHGKDGAIYHTESENFSVVKAKGNLTTASCRYFEVLKPNGLRYFYGNNEGEEDNSKLMVKLNGRREVLEWFITRIEDPHGNYVTFEYDKSNDSSISGNENNVRISGIKYTANDEIKLKPSYEVYFLYDSLVVPHISYLNGFKITQNMKLDAVDIRSENGPFKFYDLMYDQKDHLIELKECTGSDLDFCKRSTKFDWSYTDTIKYYQDEILIPKYLRDKNRADIKLVDINTDGFEDIIHFESREGKYYLVYYLSNGFNDEFRKFEEVEIQKSDYDYRKNSQLSDIDGDFTPDVILNSRAILSRRFDKNSYILDLVLKRNKEKDIYLTPVEYKEDFLKNLLSNYSVNTNVTFVDFDGDFAKELFISKSSTKQYVVKYIDGKFEKISHDIRETPVYDWNHRKIGDLMGMA